MAFHKNYIKEFYVYFDDVFYQYISIDTSSYWHVPNGFPQFLASRLYVEQCVLNKMKNIPKPAKMKQDLSDNSFFNQQV